MRSYISIFWMVMFGLLAYNVNSQSLSNPTKVRLFIEPFSAPMIDSSYTKTSNVFTLSDSVWLTAAVKIQGLNALDSLHMSLYDSVGVLTQVHKSYMDLLALSSSATVSVKNDIISYKFFKTEYRPYYKIETYTTDTNDTQSSTIVYIHQ